MGGDDCMTRRRIIVESKTDGCFVLVVSRFDFYCYYICVNFRLHHHTFNSLASLRFSKG